MEGTAPIKDMKFFFAGKAIFTVSSPTGERFTFRVDKKEANANFQIESFFIKVMTGSDNESHYTYMGLLNRNGTIKITKGSKVTLADRKVKVAEWAIRRVMLQDLVKYPGYEIRHAGRCCVCGRTLTTPESIDAGIGPKCAGRM